MSESKLSARKKVVLAMILSGSTQTAAAKAIGVKDQTVMTWVRDPEFKAELARLQSERFSNINRKLVEAADLAIKVLRDVLESPTAALYVKVNAANSILGKLVEISDAITFDERLRKVEESLENGQYTEKLSE